MERLRITSEPTADAAAKDLVRDALDESNMVITGWRDYRPLVIFLRDETRNIQGGALGHIWGAWLHLSYLWVAEPWRGKGYGTALLRAAEEEAREHRCQGVFLDSFDFQAPDFYKRYGYEVYGELHGYPPGHTLYYLHKDLKRLQLDD